MKIDPKEFDSVYRQVGDSPRNLAKETPKKKRNLKGITVFMSQKDEKWKETLTKKIEETSMIEETSNSESSEEEPESSSHSFEEKKSLKDNQAEEEKSSVKVPFNSESKRNNEIENSKTESSVVDFIESQIIKNKVPEVRQKEYTKTIEQIIACLLYTSPSPRDLSTSRMPSSA